MSDITCASVKNTEPVSAAESVKSSYTAQEQEVNDLSEFLKIEHHKYIQYKIIYDALEEYINESDNTEDTLKTKVRDIILSENLAQTMVLETSEKCFSSMLGACNINSAGPLSYAESSLLQDILKHKLDDKYRRASVEFHKLTNKNLKKTLENVKLTNEVQMISDDRLAIEYRNKLVLEQEQYIKNLLSLQELLREISDLRLKKLPAVIDQKIKECQMEEKINQLKYHLLHEKGRIDLFTETNFSLKAYRELIKDIKEQQHEYQREIEHLTDLKEKYNQVSCRQYDDILKSYIQYKASIEKKKLLYNCVKN